MRSSEALDPNSDFFDPELVPVEYDDEAMFQAMSEMRTYDFAPDNWD